MSDAMTKDEFLVLAREACDEIEHMETDDEEDWVEVFLSVVVALMRRDGWVFNDDDDDESDDNDDEE